jgi:ketosteroid isomerase-like protein
MSPAEKRDLAIEYLRRLERNDLEGALSMTSEDAVFWIPGPGEMNREQLRAFFDRA